MHPGLNVPRQIGLWVTLAAMTSNTPPRRRQWLGQALVLAAAAPPCPPWPPRLRPAGPRHAGPAAPGDDAPHKIVYQLNHHEPEYQEAHLQLHQRHAQEVRGRRGHRRGGVWCPGIHLLAKKPQRPVPEILQQRARSMAQAYGVRFIACGNTMHTVGWTADDMLDFATVEEVGAAAVMELQEKGYAYLAW